MEMSNIKLHGNPSGLGGGGGAMKHADGGEEALELDAFPSLRELA
jgi:hypothetical protein